jgi:hypothetical protein
VFDTDSRADSAQILLTNSTGASKTIIASWIRGKPVTRLSDGKAGRVIVGPNGVGVNGKIALGGYRHDKFVDYESIAKNGERTFETGNNFVVTADQVNKLADYYWKLNKTAKHIYTLSLLGFQSWYEPGEWYTLQIGGVGEAEYIDSTVECFDVRCSLSAGGAPSTSVSFREVEESWKFDSNEVVRQIASGGFSRRPSQNVVTVAAQYYSGYADYYCDGTDDQEEINNAITYLSQAGGGIAQITKGDYSITSSITMLSNIIIRGEGPATNLERLVSGASSIILANGSSSSNIIDCSIENIKVSTNASDSGAESLVKIVWGNKVSINNTTIIDPVTMGIRLTNCNNANIQSNIISKTKTIASGSYCIGILVENLATGYGNVTIINNNVAGFTASSNTYGIFLESNSYPLELASMISNNRITSVVAKGLSTANGIYVDENRAIVQNNNIRGTKNETSSLTEAYGLRIIGDNNIVGGNYIFNNGADLGIGNSSLCNFKDLGTDTQWAG